MGAFGVLLFSSLPVQREFAIFSIIGIGASVLLALIVLPHVIRTGGHPAKGSWIQTLTIQRSKWVVCGWLLLISVCGWQAMKLQFNGDLRAMNLVPDEIRVAENKMRQTWGNFRGKAVIFTEGSDLQNALEANDRLFQYLSQNIASDQIVSLAPILPSFATQQLNRQRWSEFWSDERKAFARHLLTTEGQPLGFTPTAFEPFFERLSRPPAPASVEKMRELGFGEILDALILQFDQKIQVLTLVPDVPEIAALINQQVPSPSGVRLVSQRQFAQIISKAIADDFIHFILKSSVVVCLLLGLLFRNLKMVLAALIPVVTGMIFMVGVMGMLGIAFNLFNIVAAILIIGLGVDYGIFMVYKVSKGADHHTERAVFVSGLTTLAGFGALVIARHPALHSIGLTVLLGIGTAIPSALLVIPAVYRKR
jgi:predicted exporter